MTASVQTHMQRSRRIFAACLIFVAAVLVQLIAWEPDLNPYDEGIILTGADAIYHGRLPYKDFWTMYAPGQFYLLALLFHIFEPQEYLARCIGIVFRAAIIALVWYMLQRFVRKSLATFVSGIVLFILIYIHVEVSPVFPATVFALLAVLLVERGMTRRQPVAMLGAGICTAASACFRHDLGVYTAAALMAGAVLLARPPHPASWRSTAKALALYVAGISILAIPVAAFFLWNVPLHDLHENLIDIPAHIYPAFRRLPWPGMEQARQLVASLRHGDSFFDALLQGAIVFSVYIPFAAAVPALMLAHAARRLGKTETAGFLLLCALLCLAFAAKGFIRVHLIHMAQALILAAPLLAILASRLPHMRSGLRVATLAVLIPSGVMLLVLGAAGVISTWHGTRHLAAGTGALAHCGSSALPRIRCVATSTAWNQRLIFAVDFLRQHAAPGEPVYVGAGRHDKIVANDVALYFLVNRPPATKWYELHPGVQTRAETQLHMIEEMRRTPPRAVALDMLWDNAAENNLSAQSSGVHFLDNWLDECYEEKGRFETMRVLAPRLGSVTNERCVAPK